MTVLEQINQDLNTLSNIWAQSNAHGIPVTAEGSLTLNNLRYLNFEEKIFVTDHRLPDILRDLADILDKYFGVGGSK